MKRAVASAMRAATVVAISLEQRLKTYPLGERTAAMSRGHFAVGDVQEMMGGAQVALANWQGVK